MSIFKNLKITPKSVQDAGEWFKRKIRDLHLKTVPHNIGHSSSGNPFKGHMFLFNYDAKFKDELPYWDTYPLVLPFNVKSDRFWGLNLHYLPPEYRLQLLAALNKLVTDSKIPDQRKFEMSWALLTESSRLNLVKPCVHQYLLTGNHVQSKFLMIDSEEWVNAALLPFEAFKTVDKSSTKPRYVNYNKKDVWSNSLK